MSQKSAKTGDIALNTFFVIMVAIISIGLMLVLFGGKFPAFANNLYCGTVYHVQSAIFIPEAIRADESACPDEPKGFVADPIKPVTITIDSYDDGTSRKTLSRGIYTGYITLPGDLRGDDIEILAYTIELSSTPPVESSARISINNEAVAGTFISKAPDYRFTLRNDTFLEDIQDSMASCTAPPCRFDTKYQLGGGEVKIESIAFEFSACYISDVLVAHMIKCYEDGNFGDSLLNKSCAVLPISEECPSLGLSEVDIITVINENNLQSILPEDSLEVKKNLIEPGDNILIEYDGESGKVIVT